jgi:hypothetical protein
MEAEKKRDRLLQKISTVAWVVTLAALIFTALGIGTNVYWAVGAYSAGQVGLSVIFREAMPFVWATGGVALVVAVMSTAAGLVRFRAASLDEIRIRLSALEEMIVEQQGGGVGG